MTNENMELWHSVEKTDPAHTKPITGKPYKGNSPKPYWLIMRATEIFGPCGIGWGFTVDERVEMGALLAEGHFERLHVAKVKVWYKWKGERGEVEHIGATPLSGKRSTGALYTDEDAPKKSITDGLVKALSMIGFAGDIFLGRYDDSKYVNETRQEFADAAHDDTPPAPERVPAKVTSGPPLGMMSGEAGALIANTKILIYNATDADELITAYKKDGMKRERLLSIEQRQELQSLTAEKVKQLRALPPSREAAE